MNVETINDASSFENYWNSYKLDNHFGVELKDVKIYCPVCKDYMYSEIMVYGHSPNALKCKCRQCHHDIIMINHLVDNVSKISTIYDVMNYDMCSLIPKSVNYYMGQAFMCKSVGANSAALAMYRSALEWVLEDKGYKNGTLNDKIELFNNKPPENVGHIDIKYMTVIRKLGNKSVHSNDDNIDLQYSLDDAFVNDVGLTMEMIIEAIYVIPDKNEKRLLKISSRVDDN